MIHQLIGELQKEAIPVEHSCRILDVSRSGFYEAQPRSAKPVVCKASVHLKAAFMASHQSFAPLLDTSTYFHYHHTAADTLDKVDPDKLRRHVAVMSPTAWLLANVEQPIGRTTVPAPKCKR